MNDKDLPVSLSGKRHILQAEEELRLEVPHTSRECSITLLKGSCELWGLELALGHEYCISGGFKWALFTWHGCVLQVEKQDDDDAAAAEDMVYVSDETTANVAYVNTHAQLEVLRDEALAKEGAGPRVLIVGPPECGKSSLAKVLIAYATKLGRTPLWVDLDPSDNALSVPGTLAVAPISTSALTVETFGTTGIPPSTAAPLVFWYSAGTLDNPELFKAQVSSMARKIHQRLAQNVDENASGIIVNTNGNIQADGYQMILHTLDELDIDVILIMGHDRLYSMLTSHFKAIEDWTGKIIKLPRSGGVVSRDAAFRRISRSLAIKRYFYGTHMKSPTTGAKLPELTPFAMQVPFKNVTLYKLSSVSLSNALLPVGQQQSTEAVQLTPVNISEGLVHNLIGVCHPAAVQSYMDSGKASDLYESAVAGFCVVEKVNMDTDMLHLLSPCAGTLPSHTFLVGDITFME